MRNNVREEGGHGKPSVAAYVVTSVIGLTAALVAGAGQADPAAPAQDSEVLQEVVVTGSHFLTPNDTSPSPIAMIDSSELLHQGTARAEDLLNTLPQTNAGLSIAANGAGVAPLTGTATVDLRGIGAFRTLVLMNGRRMNPGDPINPSADLNTVPTALVKRVEVLTGGASSIYGSDAIAGVVNFVMDTGFTGTKFQVEGGVNRGSNDNAGLQSIARASGVTAPIGTVYDGRTVNASAVFGTDLFGGDGHVVAFLDYAHAQAVAGSSRDFSVCSLQETATSFACILDPTTSPAQFISAGGTGLAYTLDSATGNTFRPFDATRDLYNPAPLQYLQRPDTRYNLGVFAQYKFNPHAESYLEATFSDDHTSVQYEPSGTTPTGSALNVFGINCNNPLLSANQFDALCTQAGLGLADTAQVAIGKRNVEGGQRQDDFRHRSYRLVFGVKGEITQGLNYDASVDYGNTDSREQLSRDVSQLRLARALNVVSVGGVPTCQSVVDRTDPACVPYNIYTIGGVTPAAVNYITEGGSQRGYARHAIVSGTLTAELEKYGIKSPLASEGIEVAGGAEYRTESISNVPDNAYITGDLTTTGAARPTAGSYHVYELFTEIRIPLAEDLPFAKRLAFDLSDRYARYTPQGGVNSYKFGAEWAPIDPVRFRGSYSRAVRAPNGHELFLAQTLSQFPVTDPCSGVPTASAAACANTGVTATQYGTIPAALTVNQLTGGNPNLKPETADTFTAGVVFTRFTWAPTVMLSVDYWRIRVKHFLGSLAAGSSLNSCLTTGDPIYCSLIRRDANGSLSLGNGPTAGRIIATGLNTGSYGMSGVDFEGRYSLDLGAAHMNAGKLSFSFSGTASLDNPIEIVPGRPVFDCTGLFGPTCTGDGPTSPIPTWRHRLRTTWEPRDGMEVSLNWRHIGHLKSEHTSDNAHLNGSIFPVDTRIPNFEYFDLDAGFDVSSKINIRVGVNNLFNRKPPIIGFTANPLLVNGNMAAATYDMLGRYIFLGLTAKL